VQVIALVSMRNEEDIVEYTIKHLIENDIDIIVLDDQSTDGGYEIVEEYLGKGVLELFTRESQYLNQVEKFKMLHEHALKYSPEWIIINDVDELLFTDKGGESLRAGIERVDRMGYYAINFYEVKFALSDIDNMEIINPVKRMQYFTEIKKNPNWRVYKLTYYNKPYQSHMVFGTDKDWYPERWYFKHYPYRSPEQYKKKLIDRIKRYKKDGMGDYRTQFNENFIYNHNDIHKWVEGDFKQNLVKKKEEKRLPGRELTSQMVKVWFTRPDLQYIFPNVDKGDPLSRIVCPIGNFFIWWDNYYKGEKDKDILLKIKEIDTSMLPSKIQKEILAEEKDICILSTIIKPAREIAERFNIKHYQKVEEVKHQKVIVVWGVFDEMIKSLPELRKLLKSGRAIILYWIGTDVYNFVHSKLSGNIFNDFINLCVSDNLKDELKENGVKATTLFPTYMQPPSQENIGLHDKFAVLVYNPWHRFADNKLFFDVVKALPEITFYTYGGSRKGDSKYKNVINLGWVNEKELDDLYNKITVFWRPYKHDGFSIAMLECLLRGKHCIHNISYPKVNQCESQAEVIGVIKSLKHKKLNKNGIEYYSQLCKNFLFMIEKSITFTKIDLNRQMIFNTIHPFKVSNSIIEEIKHKQTIVATPYVPYTSYCMSYHMHHILALRNIEDVNILFLIDLKAEHRKAGNKRRIRLLEILSFIRDYCIQRRADLLLIECDEFVPNDAIHRLYSISNDNTVSALTSLYSFDSNRVTIWDDKNIYIPNQEFFSSRYPYSVKGGCGIGCILVPFSILKTIPFRLGDDERWSCDWFFCADIRKKKYNICVDNTVLIRHLYSKKLYQDCNLELIKTFPIPFQKDNMDVVIYG